jgi:hypothetical protein
MNPSKSKEGKEMNGKVLLSSLVLGVFLVVLTGVARGGDSEYKPMASGGGIAYELRGTELPFPVGFVLEEPLETGTLPESFLPGFELRGTELPFPVGFVPEDRE